MGKRSTFERKLRDFYPTPEKAVQPLLPHLPEKTRFVEPCAGAGDLTGHLERAGHVCVGQWDIEPMKVGITLADVFDTPSIAYSSADLIITNPPWNRAVLHPLIDRLSAIKPTWLLFDADWVHTKQAAPFMPSLRKIISVGRVKWIPDSKMTGKDNCAWHLFDQNATGPSVFYGNVSGVAV